MRRLLLPLVLSVIAALAAPIAAQANPAITVGVVDSEISFVNYVQIGSGNHRPPGVSSALMTAGFDVVTLHDADLLDPVKLATVDVLFLPHTRAMSEEASLSVRDWVEDGGGLISAFISPRMVPMPGCAYTSDVHPRDSADPLAGWSCASNPDPGGQGAGFDFWVLEMGHESLEWGPLSEAYQKLFYNDPTPTAFKVWDHASGSSHPIVANTLANLSIPSIHFDRDQAGGAEFTDPVAGGRVTPILQYDIAPGTSSVDNPPVQVDVYDGLPAAEAMEFGSGRIVYFDFDVLDFLPELNASRASKPHAGTTQGAIAAELIKQSIEWTAAPATHVDINRDAITYGKVRVFGDAIYVEQFVKATGAVTVVGTLTTRIYNPSGVLVEEFVREKIAVYPGGPTLNYNRDAENRQMSHIVPGALLDGDYRVEVEYKYSRPEFNNIHRDVAAVQRSAGEVDTSVEFHGELVDRLSGNDRYSTAVAISEASFAPGVDAVYIATGSNFPDALAGGPAAVKAGGPILPVLSNGIPGAVRSELDRLDPKKIYVIGGPSVVSDTVLAQLDEFTTIPDSVFRIAGTDRFSTAVEISKATFGPGVPAVYVATGLNFPDALAGGPVAGLAGGPILLVGSTIPGSTKAELDRLNPAKIYVLGGTGVVSADIEAQLGDYAPVVDRLAGSDRHSTAEAISKSLFAPGVDVVYVATGDNFPDALAGGAGAALEGGPILLVRSDSIPVPTARELTRLAPKKIVILGGPGVVSESVRADLVSFES